LHPNTACQSGIVDCVNFCKGDLLIDSVTCTQLQARYEHVYSSFWVDIRVEARYMKQAIDLFMSADAWLSGVLLHRFFRPKDGRSTTE